MKNFQVSVIVLLALIGSELAMIVVKLPTASVEAQLSRPGSNVTLAPAQTTPVYIVDRNGDATTVPVRVVDRAGKDATLAVRWGDGDTRECAAGESLIEVIEEGS